jgi:L-cystine uptake protein TcyP (sodium:dicarboxylate symporter family)
MRKIIFETMLSIALFGVTILPNSLSAAWFGDTIGVSWIHTIWTEEQQEDSLLRTIQTAINWVLWILATITLMLVLYAGFQMMTSGGDSKKYDAWLSIIKNAAIWLAIIAVSWLIVSAVFRFINGSVTLNSTR